MELIINPSFRDLIPKLSTEEYEQLEKNILSDGCRDALVTWNCQIIDGHNRYKICTENELDFEIQEIVFDDEADAINWIIDNQMGRRNISDEQKSYLRGLRYRNEKRQGARTDLTSGQNVHKSTTSQVIADQYNVDEKTIRRDEKFADSLDRVAEYAPEIKEQVLRGDSGLTKNDIVTASKILPEIEKYNSPHVSNNSGNNEWYTPLEYIEMARKAMGAINLDPASCELANKTVMADKFFSMEENGLKQKWFGKVWLNPPYASDAIGKFCEKVVGEYEDHNVEEAIVLVNNATETAWFSNLISSASAVVFPKSRIKYYGPDGVKNSPLQGQAFVYLGTNPDAFIQAFSECGWGAYVA